MSDYCKVIVRDTWEDGTPIYVAQIPELPGCMTDGATVAEAKEVYIAHLKEHNLPVPPPDILGNYTLITVDFEDYTVTFKEMGAL